MNFMRSKANKDTRKDESELSPRSRLKLLISERDDDRSRPGCRIYVVPGRLRRGNEEAYTPRVISIGPIYHGKEHLQAMEANKSRYVSAFLHRLPYNLSDFIHVAQHSWEKRARDSYQNVLKFSSNEFVTMILVDGIFIVELLMRYVYENMREEGDIFQKQWMRIELLHDIMLLENQLPFFILEDLLPIAATHLEHLSHSFRDLASTYFDYDKSKYPVSQVNGEINHILDLIYSLFFHTTRTPTNGNDLKFSFEHTRSAAELHAAGVKFKSSNSCPQNKFDIEFTEANGTLRIPRLRIDELTESLFRNLIAYEQCHHDKTRISSYIMLMEILIKTPNDVHVLVDSGIIDYSLGEEYKEVCGLFKNNLYKRTTMDKSQFYYAGTCEQLNAYNRDRLHKLKAACYRTYQMFKGEYLSNPLKFISVVGAVLLLALSVIQAVCSVLSVKNPNTKQDLYLILFICEQ